MIEFEKPNIECLEINEDSNYAKFVCEPLERGYGVTIGNPLGESYFHHFQEVLLPV